MTGGNFCNLKFIWGTRIIIMMLGFLFPRKSRERAGEGDKLWKTYFCGFWQCALDSIFDACYSWWQWLWFEHKPLIMQWFKIYVYCNRRDKHWGQDVQVNKNLPLKKFVDTKIYRFCLCLIQNVFPPPSNKNSHKNEGKKKTFEYKLKWIVVIKIKISRWFGGLSLSYKH